MADVARRAGVSKMSVSRVVNGRPGVSAPMESRVRQAIRELNYVPSHRGRSLAVGETRVLAIILLDVVSEWAWSLVRGAGMQAEELGYQLLLRTTGAGQVASFDVDEPPLGSDLFDGLIIVSWRVPLAFARELSRQNFPVVLVDAYERPKRVNWVSAEDRAGARLAVRHLAGLGHRRIAFISGGAEPYLSLERLGGFEQELEALKPPAGAMHVVHGDFTRRSGYLQARRLLEAASPPTAIFAANDLMAVGALEAARELGLAVPGQLSVVGFDDLWSAKFVRPALTTVARPYEEMGAAAVRIMVDTVQTDPSRRVVTQKDLPTRLIVRESTAPPVPSS